MIVATSAFENNHMIWEVVLKLDLPVCIIVELVFIGQSGHCYLFLGIMDHGSYRPRFLYGETKKATRKKNTELFRLAFLFTRFFVFLKLPRVSLLKFVSMCTLYESNANIEL